MRAPLWKSGLCVIGAAGIAFVVHRERSATAALREQVNQLRIESAALAKLREEHAALVGRQVSAEQLSELRERQSEADRLRLEAAALQAKPVQTTAVDVAPKALKESKSTAELWTNAGRTTPDATFRTSVWAAVHGETDALANLIAFEAPGRAMIEAQFARFSEEDRIRYGSPEKVFATVLAVQMPQDLAAVEPITTTENGPDDVTVRMRMKRANETTKEANFHFQRGPDGWRMVVPTSIVESYTNMLSRSPPTPRGK